MCDTKLADGDLFPDEVDIKLDMFGSPVMDWVPGHVHRGDIVTERYCSCGHRTMQLAK
jgi:hypothetical protein